MTTTTQRPSGARLAGFAPAAAVACLLLTAAAAAQTPVRYGEPARSGTIAAANETHRYVLLGAQQGDTLRVTFSSQSCCSPTYYYHELAVSEGTNPVGTPISGVGALTVTLPSTAVYTITVRARNNQSTGWYAFRLDRLNDPVSAHRIAFDWNMRDSIDPTAGFAAYTLRAEAGSAALLRFTSQSCCSPTYYYHYAEIVDAAGQRQAIVTGNGATPVTFQASGVYTVFVAARNYQSTGWYAVSVECQSWPATPCDCTAHSSNYGDGWPGTNGVPSLTASAPRLGSRVNIDLGNSYGQPTLAFLMIGAPTKQPLTAYGGTLLVSPTIALSFMPLPAIGGGLALPLPDDPLLCGIGLAMQSVVRDPGAMPARVAFSRGLVFLMGR